MNSAPIIDTHCHTGIHKYEPIEHLLFHMDHSGVSKAVLIQYNGNSDNSYLADCLRRYSDRLKGAMIVAPDDDGTAIRGWVEQGIKGIRLSADSRAESSDPMAHWRTANELNLVVSTFCNPSMLMSPQFSEVVSTFPDLKIVIEHLGGVRQDEKSPYEEFAEILKLASYPNLTMKIPGFGEFCRLPHPFKDVPPLVRMAIDAFGPKRLMWGSDYPPVSTREGYDNSLTFPREYLSDLSIEDRNWIFSRTALQIWGF